MNKKKNENFIAVLKKYFRKDEVFLLPNILCYFRIILIFAFLALYLIEFSIAGNKMAHTYFAFAIMVVAAYTDFLDGYIARTFQLTSNLGKVLDPIADKLLQAAVAIGLAVKLHQFASVWAIFAVFLLKELTMLFEAVSLARNNKSYGGAKWYGKVSTFIFYIILSVLLLFGPFILESYPLSTPEGFNMSHLIIDTLCLFALLWLLIAWINYFIAYLRILKDNANVEIPDSSKKAETKEVRK